MPARDREDISISGDTPGNWMNMIYGANSIPFSVDYAKSMRDS
jgi:hypothetical protein